MECDEGLQNPESHLTAVVVRRSDGRVDPQSVFAPTGRAGRDAKNWRILCYYPRFLVLQRAADLAPLFLANFFCSASVRAFHSSRSNHFRSNESIIESSDSYALQSALGSTHVTDFGTIGLPYGTVEGQLQKSWAALAVVVSVPSSKCFLVPGASFCDTLPTLYFGLLSKRQTTRYIYDKFALRLTETFNLQPLRAPQLK